MVCKMFIEINMYMYTIKYDTYLVVGMDKENHGFPKMWPMAFA